MALFTKKSKLQQATDSLRGRVPGKAAVKSGAVAAGAAVAVTMASSAVSAARKKMSQS